MAEPAAAEQVRIWLEFALGALERATVDLKRCSKDDRIVAGGVLEVAKDGVRAVQRELGDFAPRARVQCDESCGAFVEPKTERECRDALAHWRDHHHLSGCSHGS